MLFRRDVTQHGTAVPANQSRTNAGRKVVVTRCNIRCQWAEGIERRFVTVLQLLVHILFDQMHRHVTRAFDKGLHVVLPGNLGQLTQGAQFGKLGFVVGIRHRTRTQAIAEREAHIVSLHDFANFLKVGVEETLSVMRQTPLRHDGTATANDPRDPLGGQRHVCQTHTGVNGEVIHTLLGLFDQRVAEQLPGQVFSNAVTFL